MLAPDLQFMVRSSEVVDEEGYAHRGSRITPIEGAALPPEWRYRDFAFAAYSGPTAAGLREVYLGRRAIWAFSAPREHCEELVIFRKGTDTRKRWNADALQDPTVGVGDMFFLMRMLQITADTPLFKQFNGEWGFWESFYVPLVDDQQTMQSLCLMDPAMCEDHFSVQRLPVTCYQCPPGCEILTIPDDLTVEYDVKIACKEMEEWTDICTKIGDDMIMQDHAVVEYKHLKPGDECIEAYRETQGLEEHARLLKRDFEQLQLPVIITFHCKMQVAKEWDPDMISLRHKYESMSTVYHMNLGGGFASMSGHRADPWTPMARLAVNALSKILARYPDIRTVMDVGCGDLAWMQYFLQDHPNLAYVGVDFTPYVLALNFRRFPKMQFLQTDLSNLTGIEVMPQGCDLVIAKDVFNHMVLPDAVNAVKRVVGTRPRFLLTHTHAAADNTGWEKRIDKHLHYTRYDYNKPPFSLPYPAVEVQRISDEAYFVLYEVVPEGTIPPPPEIERGTLPEVSVETLPYFSLVARGGGVQQEEHVVPAAGPGSKRDDKEEAAPPTSEEAGTTAAAPPGERTSLIRPVTELPDKVEEHRAGPERKLIKGLPAVEFRARCDVLFERFDSDKDGVLNYEELAAIMGAAGRRIEERPSYESLCRKLDCDPLVGLGPKDVYTMFEKAPQALWDEACRVVNPLEGMVKRGAEKLPPTFLERPLQYFLFEDEKQFGKLYVEVNAHMYYGAAESVTGEHVQAFFDKKRLELHICAPGAFGSQDIYLWKLVITPLSAEVVPEDCQVLFEETTGRFGTKRITVKLMKAQPGKKWYKVGQTKVDGGLNQRL